MNPPVHVTRHAYDEWTRITGHEPEMLDRVLPTGIRRAARQHPRADRQYTATHLIEIEYLGPRGESVYLVVLPDGAIVTVLDAQEARNNHGVGEGARIGTPLGVKLKLKV